MSQAIYDILHTAFDEGWNKGNLDVMLSLCAPGFIHHRPPFPDIEGLNAEKQDIENSFKTFSNIKFEIHELIVVKDCAVMRWTWGAEHTGRSAEIPSAPNGKTVSLEGCSILHLENGRIIEEWEFADYLGFFTQLGVLPPLS